MCTRRLGLSKGECCLHPGGGRLPLSDHPGPARSRPEAAAWPRPRPVRSPSIVVFVGPLSLLCECARTTSPTLLQLPPRLWAVLPRNLTSPCPSLGAPRRQNHAHQATHGPTNSQASRAIQAGCSVFPWQYAGLWGRAGQRAADRRVQHRAGSPAAACRICTRDRRVLGHMAGRAALAEKIKRNRAIQA